MKKIIGFSLSFILVLLLGLSAPKMFAMTDYNPFDDAWNDYGVIAIHTGMTKSEGNPNMAWELEVIDADQWSTHLIGEKRYFTEEYFNINPHVMSMGTKVYHTGYSQLLWLEYVEPEQPDLFPVLDGESAFVTNVDNPIDVGEILTHVWAIDNEDGDISHLIVVEDENYTANMYTVGTYQINLSVTDSSDNRSELTIHVLVKDVTAPVITGPSSINASITRLKPIAEIQALLSVTDNYDTSGLTILVDSNNYNANYNKVGTWVVVFSSTDASGNKGTFTVNVTVVDDVEPVISGPTTIVKSQTEALTISQIKSQLTANDNVDGNITSSIVVLEDFYTGNGHKTGQWTIIFGVTDAAGNNTEHTVTITVIDNIPPVFYVDNFFINVSQAIALTNQEIIDLLMATGQINQVGTTSIRFLKNEYVGNEHEIGVYALTIQTVSSSGNEDLINLAVNVMEDTTQDDDIIIDQPSWFNDALDHVITYWYFYLPGVMVLIIVLSKRRR